MWGEQPIRTNILWRFFGSDSRGETEEMMDSNLRTVSYETVNNMWAAAAAAGGIGWTSLDADVRLTY